MLLHDQLIDNIPPTTIPCILMYVWTQLKQTHEHHQYCTWMFVVKTLHLLLTNTVRRYRGWCNDPGNPNSSLTTSIFELTTHTIPILSPFLFMPSLYALLFVIHRIFYLLVSTHFYTCLSWKRLNTYAYKVSSPCVLLLVSLTGVEGKVPEAIFCWLSSWKYQVSSPCVLPLVSLRSEEVIMKKSAWGYLLLFTDM